jgi:hypothetical protein
VIDKMTDASHRTDAEGHAADGSDMPTHKPTHLRYTLNRSQRLVPHLRIWGRVYSPFVVLLFGFFSWRAMVGVWQLEVPAVLVFGGLAVGTFVLCRGLFLGLIDVIFVPLRHMDVTIEENAFGVLLGRERWYLFLDGVMDIRKYRDDVWTLRHWNGTVLNIAASAINDDQLAYIRAAMERGRTPEGVRAVVERGRRIREIKKPDRRA